MEKKPIGLGVVGLGRAFTLMLPTFVQDERIRLVAAVDPQPGPRTQFEADFGGRVYDSVAALCGDPLVEAVYIASPHQYHAEHVALAASAGKAVLVEKPLAITLEDCTRIVEVAHEARVPIVVGHSHSFDGPVLHAARLIQSGTLGRPRMLHTMNYTDYLYRPRRPEELDTRQGGGVVFSQAAHQVDIVRLLLGGEATSVRAYTGCWDTTRPTEGAYMALVGFEGGAFASLTYSGFAHYDSDQLMGNISEMGEIKPLDAYGQSRARLASANADREAQLKAARNYGGSAYRPMSVSAGAYHQHFGPVIVSMDHADISLTPEGLWVCGDMQRELRPTPKCDVPRVEVVDELWASVREVRPPLHSAAWARANIEVCLAILESARTGKEVALTHQVKAGIVA